MTNPNPTAVIIFSKATLAAIKLALASKKNERSAYANARALGRAANAYLDARAS